MLTAGAGPRLAVGLPGASKRRRRPRLRTILLLVNLIVLLLPLGGILVLRLYESALIRQTESELIAQGAFIRAFYLAALHRLRATDGQDDREPKDGATDGSVVYGLPLDPDIPRRSPPAGRWRPLPPVLDLAHDEIRPRAPDSIPAAVRADRFARAAGREITAILRDAQIVTLSGIRVVDFRGVVVASTGGDLDRSLEPWEEVARALRGEPVSLLRRRVDPYIAPLASISASALSSPKRWGVTNPLPSCVRSGASTPARTVSTPASCKANNRSAVGTGHGAP